MLKSGNARETTSVSTTSSGVKVIFAGFQTPTRLTSCHRTQRHATNHGTSQGRQRTARISRTSSSLVVSRTKFCTMCCVALAPTLPPRPGPVTGSSGLLLFRGSIRDFSCLRFVPRPSITSPSRNPGTACGIMMAGAASASDMSSTVAFLGGPLASKSFAPFNEVRGE